MDQPTADRIALALDRIADATERIAAALESSVPWPVRVTEIPPLRAEIDGPASPDDHG
jgi:hypothetical protein